MNDGGDCRTAPATPGLLNTRVQSKHFNYAIQGHPIVNLWNSMGKKAYTIFRKHYSVVLLQFGYYYFIVTMP